MFRYKSISLISVFLVTSFLLTAGLLTPDNARAASGSSGYKYWRNIGTRAALKSIRMLKEQDIQVRLSECLALTNAGYAEIDGRATTGALDGLIRLLNVSRGNHSLVEIHSDAGSALWFAVYHKPSGVCTYLQVNTEALGTEGSPSRPKTTELFSIMATEKINADHLYENAAEYAEKFNSRIFGGNEFRIVTIANAIAAGAPTCAVRAFEYHDHYCPGVTSGILMALYLKTSFPKPANGSYFVQTVQPWCKEDALITLLNATPGKKSYAVSYPTADDIAAWPEWAKNASTIVYRSNPETGKWEGIVLEYQSGDTGCPDYGSSVITKLCSDLWYLDHMDHPEDFIQVIRTFELPEDDSPQNYARPGVDAVLMIDNL